MGRPQVFGAGISLGMFAGLLIGTLVTMWVGDAALELAQRKLQHLVGPRHPRLAFELLLQ